METSEIILQLLIGGLLGITGQLLRFLVGYKKLSDKAAEQNMAFSDLFQANRFVISLIIGFVAGIIGVISLSDFKTSIFLANVKDTILTLIGIGYAGTDFIEGFIKKYIPDTEVAIEGEKDRDRKTPAPGASGQPG